MTNYAHMPPPDPATAAPRRPAPPTADTQTTTETQPVPGPSTSCLPRLTLKGFLLGAAASALVFPAGWLILIAWGVFDLFRTVAPHVERHLTRPTAARLPTTGVPTAGSTTSVAALMALDPTEFEHHVGRLMQAAGFTRVTVRGGSGDNGCDVSALSPAGLRTVVSCKQYDPDRAVGVRDAQNLLGAVTHFRADIGMLVTTAQRFTDPAADYADANGLVMVPLSGAIDGLGDEAHHHNL